MRRVTALFAAMLLAAACASTALADSMTIGGHDETSEDLTTLTNWNAVGSVATQTPATPGAVAGTVTGSHLLITEVGMRGHNLGTLADSTEFVEIYNPTANPVDLSTVYVTDINTYYVLPVTGLIPNVSTGNGSDFAFRFPNGSSINPGQAVVVAAFGAPYKRNTGVDADYQMFSMVGAGGAISTPGVTTAASMVGATSSNPGTYPSALGMLTNGSEFVQLFTWDGVCDLVCDLDLVYWGTPTAGNQNSPVLKTNAICQDGPDAGGAVSCYNNDIGNAPGGFTKGLATPATTTTGGGTRQRTGPEGAEGANGNGCAPKATTSVVASGTPNPSDCGQSVTINASGLPANASGTVTFLVDNVAIATVPVSNGGASTSNSFNTGSFQVTANYSGDCSYQASSNTYKQTVNSISTSTSLTSDVNPSSCGQKVNLTATVSPAASTGTVEFFDGATSLGTAPVAGGIATLSVTSLAVGPHGLTATYNGDACHTGSTSAPYGQVVTLATTTTTVGTNVNPSPFENKVTITATVNPGSATGTVDFYDGATLIGSAPVVGGVATLSYFFTTEGKHVLSAVYSGDACYAPSTSDPYSQMVDQPVAVLLSLFEANTVVDGVELRWQFSDASEVSSTSLERAPTLSGPWTRVDLTTDVQDGITVGVDRSVESNRAYSYRLVASLIGGGTVTFSPVDGRSGSLVTEFAITKITPNPTPKLARIDYSVAKETKVQVRILDLQGRTVASLVDGFQPAGRYQAVWTGDKVPAGLYFVQLQAAGKSMIRRIAKTQ